LFTLVHKINLSNVNQQILSRICRLVGSVQVRSNIEARSRSVRPFLRCVSGMCLCRHVYISLIATYIYKSSLVWFYSQLLGLGHFLLFWILFTVDRTPWMGDKSFTRPLPTLRTTQTQNKHTNISFCSRIRTHDHDPVCKREKTVHPYTARPLRSAYALIALLKCIFENVQVDVYCAL
jgi:hypothetical protein